MLREIYTRSLHLTFDGKIVTSRFIENVEMDMDHMQENYNACQEITEGKRHLSLAITSKNSSITLEAQKEGVKKDKYENVIAQAIVVHSFAQRILTNFMINFLKFPCPCRLFLSKDQAIAWLNEEWEKEKISQQKQISH